MSAVPSTWRTKMKAMYWVSNILSWSYIDINSKVHGRIDWFEEIRDMGYWWQTAHASGVCFTIEDAKRAIEDALWRRCMALAALYMENSAAVVENQAEAEADAVLVSLDENFHLKPEQGKFIEALPRR